MKDLGLGEATNMTAANEFNRQPDSMEYFLWYGFTLNVYYM